MSGKIRNHKPLRPLEGVQCSSTLTPSGVKKKLAEIVITLGGTYSSDLLAETRLLIIGDVVDTRNRYKFCLSEKYKFCARQRADVNLIDIDSIFEIYDLWKEGKSKFYKNIQNDYLIPVFKSVQFCLTRLSNVPERIYGKDYLIALIKEFGGSFSDALTKENTVVVTVERSGKRYEKAIEWNIPVVHPKWVLDCAARCAILDTKYYEIDKVSRRDIGTGSCTVWDDLKDPIDYYQFNQHLHNKYFGNPNHSKSEDNVTNLVEEVPDTDSNLFIACCFFAYGFTDNQIEKLDKVIKERGGEVFDGDYDSITHLLIPSTLAYSILPHHIRKMVESYDLKVINEWFIERSMFYKTLLMDSWSVPKKFCNLKFKLSISTSGFCGIELLHIQKLIIYMGAECNEVFNERCDLLVVNLSTLNLNKKKNPNLYSYKYTDILDIKPPPNLSTQSTKNKINAAKKWSVPVVSLAYLWEAFEVGVLPNILDYRWCIFGPITSRPASNFMEYARGVTGGTFQTQKKKNTDTTTGASTGHNTTTDTTKEHTTTKEDDDTIKNGYPQTYEPKLIPVQGSITKKKSLQNILEESEQNSFPVEPPVKLPSPKRNKQLKNWPRLTGQAMESQLRVPPQPIFNTTTGNTTRRKRLTELLEEDMSTDNADSNQIGYDWESIGYSRTKRSRTRTNTNRTARL